jgi:endonuclease/exonuclease/phosphatase (EEP) superfamily protein YafD
MDGNPLVRVQIDHLLHSPDLVTLDRRLGPRLGSDHAPLIVRLALTD